MIVNNTGEPIEGTAGFHNERNAAENSHINGESSEINIKSGGF